MELYDKKSKKPKNSIVKNFAFLEIMDGPIWINTNKNFIPFRPGSEVAIFTRKAIFEKMNNEFPNLESYDSATIFLDQIKETVLENKMKPLDVSVIKRPLDNPPSIMYITAAKYLGMITMIFIQDNENMDELEMKIKVYQLKQGYTNSTFRILDETIFSKN